MKYHVEFDLELLKNPYKGLYIAIEGIDGCGKTTQQQKLKEYFESKRKEVVVTREPRKKGLIGDMVQKILLGGIKIPPEAIQYFFATDRVINHKDVVDPALKEGKIVISDRCFWSAIVYGILDKTKNKYDLKEADELLVAQSILSMYHQFIAPDFTFYLYITLDESLKRIKDKTKKEIYEDRNKIEKTLKGYDWLANRFSKEFTFIDGELPISDVTKELIEKIEK